MQHPGTNLVSRHAIVDSWPLTDSVARLSNTAGLATPLACLLRLA